jgi:hypothetical protein
MNVEQTTQLIQLILNSALMVIASAILLSGILLRQGQLRTTPNPRDPDDLRTEPRVEHRAAKSLIKRQTTFTQRSALLMAYASGGFMASMLILVIRTLIEFNGLIPFSLVLFCLSTVALLSGIIMLLLSLHLPANRRPKPEPEAAPVESSGPRLVRPADSRRRSSTLMKMPESLLTKH